MTRPLVSVIIPAYNAGRFIGETLASVLAQTYREREIIVVDDGSTDDTAERVRAYGPAVRCIRIDNAGPGAARNAGLRAAAGAHIAFLDADDLWRPDKLAIQVAVAGRHPESGMVVCDGVQFEDDRILAQHLIAGPSWQLLSRAPDGELTGRFYRVWLDAYGLKTPGQTLIPRHVVEHIGPQQTGRSETAEWDYSLRIARLYPVTLHRDSLVRWRYHATSTSGPLERREFRWGLRRIPTLRRHRTFCAPEDRAAVAAALRSVIRDTARGLYYHGVRTGDRPYARAMLLRLLRLAPGNPEVLACLAASSLPWTVVRGAVNLRRRLRRRGHGQDPARPMMTG